MKFAVLLSLIIVSVFGAFAAKSDALKDGMVISFYDEQPKALKLVKPSATSAGAASVIDVNTADVKQVILGFGANLTQASVKNINRLDPKRRSYILRKLFSKSEGYGLNYLRVPLGATDFSDPVDGNFTYDDTPGNVPDLALTGFSLEKDAATIALLKEIRAINPDLKLMLTAWTAPAWMKDSLSLQGGFLKDEFAEVYAQYLARALSEYKKLGFNVDSISMVNEPGVFWAPFTCMGMSPEYQGLILSKYLGPAVRDISPTTKILALDHNWGMIGEVEEQFERVPESRKFTDGIAFHCYGGNVENLLDAKKEFPELMLYQTECSGSDGPMSQRHYYYQWWINSQVISAGRNGASVSLGWNIMLDEFYGPRQSFCRNCRGLVSIAASTDTITNEYPELRALGLGAKYTFSGTHVIGSESADAELKNVAYLNTDGSRVVVVMNTSEKLKLVRVRESKGLEFYFELPADGAASIKWK
jgi:glucosylceramidase